MPRKIDNSKRAFKKVKRLLSSRYFENEEKKLQRLLLDNSNAIDWSKR